MPDSESVAQTPDAARAERSGGVEFGILANLLSFTLRRAQMAVAQKFQSDLGDFEVTSGQFSILVLIRQNPGLSQSDLGSALAIDRSTMVAVIDRLEKRDLVVRSPSPYDRRSYALALTPAGERLLTSMIPHVEAHEATLTHALTEQETQDLNRLLRRIARLDHV